MLPNPALCRLVGCGEVVLSTQEDRVLADCCDGSLFVLSLLFYKEREEGDVGGRGGRRNLGGCLSQNYCSWDETP